MSIPPETFWGFFGALMFAAPNLSKCIYAARKANRSWTRCAVDAVMALIIGTGLATAFLPWVVDYLGGIEDRKMPGLAIIVGLLANPVQQKLVKELPNAIVRFIQSKGPTA